MNPSSFSVRAHYVDIQAEEIYPAELTVEAGRIVSVRPITETVSGYLLPGFVDSHVHIESSMLVPAEFARLAVVHGTVATVSDPHEIANVCGLEGVQFMVDNGRSVPFHFFFGAPSCVPATVFETAGASLDAEQVAALLAQPHILYLSEMMNFPGVLQGDKEVMAKIAAARRYNKPVDGHAPALRGEQARRYIDAGISTDHECFTQEEALEKIGYGMKILIREGSAAKNFDALADLFDTHPGALMFCTDDKHPDSLVEGHINQLCARAVARGKHLFSVLRAACLNPVQHYALPVGQLRIGDAADFILVEDLQRFRVLKTWVGGQLVAENGRSFISAPRCTPINRFAATPVSDTDLKIPASAPFVKEDRLLVIEALDGQLITPKTWADAALVRRGGELQNNPGHDLLKIVVLNRYQPAKPALAFIHRFGLQRGAIASTVAHDSHNIIAVGCDDASLARAINLLVDSKGGISCVDGDMEKRLALPVAGLMSDGDGYEVAAAYTEMDRMAKNLGSTLSAPFMTLSFMALLVIPHLKLSDKGLFDGDAFSFVE